MPPGEFGVLSIVHTLLSFSTFFVDAGVGNVLFRRALPDRETRSALFWWSVGWGSGFALLFASLGPWLADFYQMPRLYAALPLAALGLAFTAAGTQHRVLLRRALRFDLLAKIELVAFVANFGLTVLLAYQGYGCFAVVWGNLANMVGATLLCFMAGERDWMPRFYFRRALVRPFLSFGLYQMGERGANYLAERSDVLIIGKILGPEALGLYDVMKQLLSRPEAMFNAVAGSVALPVMAERADDAAFLKKAYMGLTRRLNALNFPVFVFCIAFPGLLLGLGPNWLEQAAVFQWLAAYQLLHSTCNPIGALQMAKGRADLGFYWNLLLLLLLPLSVLLGLRGDLVGVAAAIFGLFLAIQPLFFWWMVRPLIPVSWKTYYFSWLPPLLAALLSALVAKMAIWPVGDTVILDFGFWILDWGPKMAVWPVGDTVGSLLGAGLVYAAAYMGLSFVFNRKIFEF